MSVQLRSSNLAEALLFYFILFFFPLNKSTVPDRSWLFVDLTGMNVRLLEESNMYFHVFF
jgi:hypothetical protein